jgi:hypothetical protein
MRRVFKLILITILVSAGFTNALPKFSIRTGLTCQGCHINPTGGLMRNNGGYAYGKNLLPMKSSDAKISNKFGQNFYFGLDMRNQLLLQRTDSTERLDFHRMTTALYLGLDLSDKISGLFKYDVENLFYEGYVIASVLPNKSYIKAGTFLPNFGLRLDDHTAYTRGGDAGFLTPMNRGRGLIFRPGYAETGIELGGYIKDFLLLTASVGQPLQVPFIKEPSYTGSVMFYPSLSKTVNLLFGGSYSSLKIIAGQGSRPVSMYGGFLGIGIADLVLAGEYDFAEDYQLRGTTSNALMLKAAYTVLRGLDVVLRYDLFDPGSDDINDESSRLIAGLEIFPFSFIEIRPEYRFQFENPEVLNDAFLIQLHLYY